MRRERDVHAGKQKSEPAKKASPKKKAAPKASPKKRVKIPDFVEIRNPPKGLLKKLKQQQQQKEQARASPVRGRRNAAPLRMNAARNQRSPRATYDNRAEPRRAAPPRSPRPRTRDPFSFDAFEERRFTPGEMKDLRLMEDIKIHATLDRLPAPLPQQKGARVPLPSREEYYNQNFDSRRGQDMGDLF